MGSLGTSLLETARRLVPTDRGRPRQTDVRRAISPADYAVFHALAKSNADCLAYASPGRLERAWVQAYRSLEHGALTDKARQNRIRCLFPDEIQRFLNLFLELRDLRHLADYDPTRRFTVADAEAAYKKAEEAMALLDRAGKQHRRALAVLCLLLVRKGLA